MCVSRFFFALTPVCHSPLTAPDSTTQRSWHARAQSGEILCESASLLLLSKLNGEDVLFIHGESPCEWGPAGKQEVWEVFPLCQPLSNWLMHPVLQLAPRRKHAALAHINYSMSERPSLIKCTPFIPVNNNIFLVFTLTHFFFFTQSVSVECARKNTLWPNLGFGSTNKSKSDFKAAQLWFSYNYSTLSV